MSRLAVLMPSLTGGGAERVLLQLAKEFNASGHQVDLLISRVKGRHGEQLPPDLRTIRLRRGADMVARARAMAAAAGDRAALLRPVLLPLKSSWALRYLPDLTRYLRQERPDALLSANTWPNLVALWARRRAGVATRVVVTEHVQMSARVRHLAHKWRWRHLPDIVHRTYPRADGIVAVSRGVANDLVTCAGLPADRVQAIPNPVVTASLFRRAEEPPPHPWLVPGSPPVVLAAGRLHPQKDFPTLLRGFAEARRLRPALRLVLLGEGAERPALARLAGDLGIDGAVLLAGHVDNPYAYMSRAAVFALSSIYEGLPTVLIEALACGAPVVSTDCPSGPAEILENGQFGRLVPVGNWSALAAGILGALDAPDDRETRRRRGLDFTSEAVARRYLPVLLGTLDNVTGPCGSSAR
jgi:glycosyltransferase involved in cell wall biosynthesis